MNYLVPIIVLSQFVLVGCVQEKDPTPPLRQQTLTSETAIGEDSTLVNYERGVIQVPINRATHSEQTWDVEFVRFKRAATASPDTPPIFILRGGPGSESGTQLLEDPGYYAYFIEPYTQITDVIIPGQRGLQTSGATPCDPIEPLTFEQALNDEARQAARSAALDLCRKKWEAEGVDLTGFNIIEMAGDVYDIARGLGYEKIQLIGQSFGSHWGMATLRYYPDLIARATLSGLEGPDHTYDMPGHVLATLERIAASAEASPELAPYIPEQGLLEAYRELIQRADETPIQVSLESPDSGEMITISLDGDDLRSFTRGYSRGTSWRFIMPAWPLDILALLDGNFSYAARSLVRDHLFTRLRDAAYYQIDCASGISQERGKILRSDLAADLVGPLWEYYDSHCSAWDADLGEDFRAPFSTDVPALLINGDWDTSTPYENAQEVRSYFQNHRFVHVRGGSHGAFREAREDVDGFREQVYQWLETGSYTHIPETVTLPPMQWRAPED